MPEALLSLRYEGPAVDEGSMDVRQLAPALIAAADAVQEAHLLLRVPGPRPQVEVRSTRPGSFIVDLAVADAHILEQVESLLNSHPVGAINSLTTLTTAVVTSFGLIKKLRNRRVARAEPISPSVVPVEEPVPGLIRLVLEDGVVIETTAQTFQLVLDATYRRSVQGIVQPLTGSASVTTLVASTEDLSETVTFDDVTAFDVPPVVEEELADSVIEVVLRPVSVSFSEGNKWRFNDGESTFFAAIEDPQFLEAIELGTERFAKNDMLRVRLRVRQSRTETGLRSERSIVEVLDHIPGAVQLDLFASQPTEDENEGDA